LEENKGPIKVIDFIFIILEEHKEISSGANLYIRKEKFMIEII
jgi:hypothetical protein